MVIEHHFPAGRYYIGDLCYVLPWERTLAITKMLDGEFYLDGNKFVIYSTAYGDGSYPAVDDLGYLVDYCPVDSGTIGMITTAHMNEFDCIHGMVVDMDEDFTTSPEFGKYGILKFGHILVHTGFEDEEDE